MKPNATNFYYLKLRNLFLAHQETYAKIEKDCTLDATTKTSLTKKLYLYEAQIKKLLTEKEKGSNDSSSRNVNSGGDHASTFFALDKNKYSHSVLSSGQLKQFQPKQGSTAQYFAKRRSVSTSAAAATSLEKELNSLQNIISTNASQFIECFEEKMLLDEQNSELDAKLGDDGSKATSVVSSLDDQSEVDLSSACTSPVKEHDSNDDHAKTEFFRKLGLIPRDEHEEITSRKNSRKRRTTANPQFSSAALEAKRATKMEIIAERKNRRQLTLEKRNAFKSLCADENRQGKMTLFSDNKSKNNFKIDNKQLYPGLYLVKRVINAKYYCKVCMDLCQCSLDTVIACKRCSTFFHLTCVAPKKDISSLLELNCPACSLEDTQSEFSGKRRELLKRLHELRIYIQSLSHANGILQMLCEKREGEKTQLLDVVEMLQKQKKNLRFCLNAHFDYESLESFILPSDTSSSIGQNDSIDLSNALAECQSDFGNGDHHQHDLLAQPSMDDFDELDESTNLYEQSNEMSYNAEPATKCDTTDLPVLTFCV